PVAGVAQLRGGAGDGGTRPDDRHSRRPRGPPAGLETPVRPPALILAGLLAAVPGGLAADAPVPAWAAYGRPEAVRLQGYAGEAMEPFVSRDGRVLVFNNRNDPPERTDLYWAERVDDLTWRFRGPVAGATSATLAGVG